MKKFLIGILGVCLLIGIPFIVMDLIAAGNGPFNIPSGYKKIKVSLNEKARNDEIVLTKELENATELSFVIQSDSETVSTIMIKSDNKLIGCDTNEERYSIRSVTDNSYLSPKLLLQPGRYTITVSNMRTDGDIMIGYKEKELEASEYKRLLKIDKGELNNPPEGYELVYSTDLSGLNNNKEVVYTVTLDRTKNAGISVYTNSSKGDVSVDFIGEYSNFLGLVSPKVHYICDRMENKFQQGTYEVQLSCENADGQVYIFIKK